jgi:rare lipoprotein A
VKAPLAGAAAAVLLAGCAEPVEQGWAPVQAPYPPPAVAAPPAPWGAYGQAPAPAPYQSGRASYYSDRLAGRPTATGEPYDPRGYTAAHRTLPLGSVVEVSREDGRHVRVRINDRGPYAHGRIIDLSRQAAAELGMVRAGVAEVVLRVVWVPARAM